MVLLEPEGTQGREDMSKRRWIISIVLFLTALAAVTPALAGASPLLSGYGSPGEGNQAILGAALLNGPKGGGGAGGGGSGGGAARSESGAALSGTSEGAGQSAANAPARTHGGTAAAPGGRGRARGGDRRAGRTAGSARPKSVPLYPTAATGATGGSRPVGLSADDFVYILLALGVLIFTGLFTRRLARGSQRVGTGS
jgi:hypothetical protein